MQKNKDNKVKPIFIWKTQKIIAVFKKFKKEMSNLVTFGKDDEMVIKLTLDNLFNEIVSAANVIKKRRKK